MHFVRDVSNSVYDAFTQSNSIDPIRLHSTAVVTIFTFVILVILQVFIHSGGLQLRLFHVSEESNIKQFVPRIPYRKDMDQSKGLVWSLTEASLPNWLTPRDCPRVGYRVTDETTIDDISKFFSSSSQHCVSIEHAWYERMANTTLYVYEFDASNFYFDETAGFYVSDQTEIPIAVVKYDNLFEEQFKRNVEVRMVNNLWKLAEEVRISSLKWSLCRMGNAQPAS